MLTVLTSHIKGKASHKIVSDGEWSRLARIIGLNLGPTESKGLKLTFLGR